MTQMQLNAELLRNMSIIAEDENMLKRAAKYLRVWIKLRKRLQRVRVSPLRIKRT